MDHQLYAGMFSHDDRLDIVHDGLDLVLRFFQRFFWYANRLFHVRLLLPSQDIELQQIPDFTHLLFAIFQEYAIDLTALGSKPHLSEHPRRNGSP